MPELPVALLGAASLTVTLLVKQLGKYWPGCPGWAKLALCFVACEVVAFGLDANVFGDPTTLVKVAGTGLLLWGATSGGTYQLVSLAEAVRDEKRAIVDGGE